MTTWPRCAPVILVEVLLRFSLTVSIIKNNKYNFFIQFFLQKSIHCACTTIGSRLIDANTALNDEITDIIISICNRTMATAAGHTQFTTTKENENYARLSRAIVDWMTFILRELLTFYILPLDIERKSRPFQSTKLKNLRQEQWDLIQKASTDGYFNFDITLLYALLRNLCTSVQKPSKQWGTNDLPEHNEVTLGDDIERIRIVKNSLQSHIPTTKLNDTEFECYWKILRDVCVRLDSKFNKKYTDGLDNLKTICMDYTRNIMTI